MFKSSVKMSGRLIIKKFNEKQELIYQTEVENLVVTAGKSFIASRIVSGSAAVMGYMAIGDNATVSALPQTNLGNQRARVATSTATAVDNNITFTASFGAGVGTGSIQEAGIFNASSSGTMLCRTTFPVITKAAGETIAISWVVSVG
jgi:hypothetical protein